MKNVKFISLLTFLITFAANASYAAMAISSTDLKDGETIQLKNVFNGFGCKGNNISPQITISNIPKDTKSLALTFYDPDAPTGSGWWHWMVYNMPSYTKNILPGNLKIARSAVFGPDAVFVKNDYGAPEYGGPCPPVGGGKHRYILTVFALSVSKLDLPKDASSAMVGYNINANTIERASITSYYER